MHVSMVLVTSKDAEHDENIVQQNDIENGEKEPRGLLPFTTTTTAATPTQLHFSSLLGRSVARNSRNTKAVQLQLFFSCFGGELDKKREGIEGKKCQITGEVASIQLHVHFRSVQS